MPGLCKFNEAWLEKDCYKRWLKWVGSDWWKAYCIYCKRNIDIASMGEGNHAKGKLTYCYNTFLSDNTYMYQVKIETPKYTEIWIVLPDNNNNNNNEDLI